MNILLESFADILVIWQTVFIFWFIILPVAFYYLFKILWMDFVHDKFRKSIEWMLLEIVPPKDIEKSPKPMESFFSGIIGMMSSYSATDEYLNGKYDLDLSLELVSDEGIVRMYIHTPKMFRKLVESHIYSQYPETEIIEVPDYVDDMPKVLPNKKWDLWGCDFKLTRPDAYPIKTYPWFEEDVTGKMIDPLSSVIESMGAMGPGEKLWFQIVISPKDISQYEKGKEIVDEFLGKAKKSEGLVNKLLEGLGNFFGDLFTGMFGPTKSVESKESSDEQPVEFRLTPGEKTVLKAIEESIGKGTFETKMRFIYFGKKDVFNKVAVSSFIGSLKQFSDLNLNSFWVDSRSKTFALHLLKEERLNYRQRKIFRRFKDRDKEGVTFYLNTEELATIFHMPDMAVVAPSFHKVEARRGGAPPNLPIG